MQALPRLSWLIAPTLPSTFFNEHFERKPLVVARNDPGYLDLLTPDDLDACIARGMSYPDVAVIVASKKLGAEHYCHPSGLVDPIRLWQLYADGATVVTMQLERFEPRLGELCRMFEAELSYRFQANVYLTPPGARGFRSHYDRHDVFVLQLAGAKHWRLFDTPVDLPHGQQPFDAAVAEDAPCTLELDMRPGDVLYLPRGTMHDATSLDSESLHLTLGVMHPTWGDLLAKAVEGAALRNPELRKALPFGYARHDFDRAKAREAFTQKLARALLDMGFDGALDHFVDDFVSTAQPRLPGQLSQTRWLAKLRPETRVGPRPGLLYRLGVVDDVVVLSCHGKELTMPAQVEPLLDFALTTESYAIGELPVRIPDEAKIELVTGLIREGLLRVLDELPRNWVGPPALP